MFIGEFGCETEELDHVGDVIVAARAKELFNLGDIAAKFRGGFRIDLLHLVRFLTDDVIRMGVAEAERVETGSVVEKGSPNEADVFKRAETAINRDQIA